MNEAEMVVNIGKKLSELGFKGYSHNTFRSVNANMKYEIPVPGTDDLVYFTAEELNGAYVEYPARAKLLNKYWGQDPISAKYWTGSSKPFSIKLNPETGTPEIIMN
jgi:hypothetical protein